MSGCFRVTSCDGAGVLALDLGVLKLSATLKSDGTVVSSGGQASDGTTPILGPRTGR